MKRRVLLGIVFVGLIIATITSCSSTPSVSSLNVSDFEGFRQNDERLIFFIPSTGDFWDFMTIYIISNPDDVDRAYDKMRTAQYISVGQHINYGSVNANIREFYPVMVHDTIKEGRGFRYLHIFIGSMWLALFKMIIKVQYISRF